MSRKPSKKKVAAAQQKLVNEIATIKHRLGDLADGLRLGDSEQALKYFPGEEFAFVEGQLSVMFDFAMKSLEYVLTAFEDCAEEGVEVPKS